MGAETAIILLVDDPESFCSFQQILSKIDDVSLVMAENAKDALMHLNKNEIALILVDISMPTLGDFDPAKQISNLELDRNIPILICTAFFKDIIAIFENYEPGTVDYIFKPYENTILLRKVQTFVELFRRGKALELQENELRLKKHRFEKRIEILDELCAISQLDMYNAISLKSIFKQTVDTLPAFFESPEVAVACIEFEGRFYSNKNFQETLWSVSRPIKIHGRQAGALTLSYLEAPPRVEHEEIFQKEELQFLEEVAERLGQGIECISIRDSLKKSEASVSHAQLVANMGFWEHNLRTDTDWWSDQMYRIFGFEPRTVEPGFSLLKKLMLPDDSILVQQMLHEAVHGSKAFDIQFRVFRNGSVVHLSLSGAMGINPENGDNILHGVLQDITGRVELEQALRDQETLLDKMGAMANLGGWEYDVRLNRLTWSKETYRIHRVSSDFTPSLETAWSFFTSEHQPLITDAARRCLKEGYPFDLELELLTPDKRRLWVRIIGEPTYENGRISKIGGTCQDITEQKRILEHILQSEEKFRALYDSIRDAILVTDTGRKIIDMNPAFTELFGYLLDELKWKQTLIIFENEAEYLRLDELIRQYTDSEDMNFIVRVRFRKKSGVIFTGETNVFPLRNAQGTVTGVISLIRDISERLKTEEQIQNLARFPAESPHPILRVSNKGMLIYANPASVQIRRGLGLREHERIPDTLNEIIEKALLDNSASPHEVQAGELTYALSISQVSDRSYVNIYGMDITGRKRAEEKARQRSFELEVLNKLAGKLGYTLDYGVLLKLLIENLDMVLQFDVVAGMFLSKGENMLLSYCPHPLTDALRRELTEKMLNILKQFQDEITLADCSELQSLTCVVSDEDKPIDGLDSNILVPLFEENGLVAGVLYVGARSSDAFTPEQINMVFKVAEQSSSSVARLRALVEESRQELEQLVNCMPVGIVLLDRNNVVVMLNPKGSQMLPLPEGEGVGCKLERIYDIKLENLFEALHTGEEQHVEFSGPPRRIIRVTGQQLLSGPQSGGYVLILSDVTREQADAERIKASERRFRSLFNNSSDAIFVHDLKGRFLDVNEMACERFGYTHDEMLHMGYFDLTPTTDIAENLRACLQQLRSQDFIFFETSQQCKDGSIIPTEINAKRLVYDGESLILATARNITERKRAEQERIEHEKMLDSILNGIQAAFFILEPKTMTVVEANEQAATLLGLIKEDVIGQYCYTLLGMSICTPPKSNGHLLENSSVLAAENTLTLPDGSILPVFYNRLCVKRGGKDYVAIIVFDTTERKALERQLSFAQKLESLGQLAAGIAHEINTPIQYVSGNINFFQTSFEKLRILLNQYGVFYSAVREHQITDDIIADTAQVLQKVKLDYLLEEIPYAIDDAHEGVERVSTIVQAMRKFSHPDIGEFRLMDVNESIENTIIVARNEWKYDSELTVELEKGLPPIFCLPGDFNQAILNVLVNAAHANSAKAGKSGVKERISITTTHSGDFVEIRIRDTGTGILPENRNRIFDPFFTTKEVGKGTGQGLAITHAIVGKHGGTIDFDTTVNEGTTFILRFPFTQNSGKDAQ